MSAYKNLDLNVTYIQSKVNIISDRIEICEKVENKLLIQKTSTFCILQRTFLLQNSIQKAKSFDGSHKKFEKNISTEWVLLMNFVSQKNILQCLNPQKYSRKTLSIYI